MTVASPTGYFPGIVARYTAMEPRPYDRGKARPRMICQWCSTPQWSHGHMTVERGRREDHMTTTTRHRNGATAI